MKKLKEIVKEIYKSLVDWKNLLNKLRMIQSEKRSGRILKSLRRNWLRIEKVVDYVFESHILTKRL